MDYNPVLHVESAPLHVTALVGSTTVVLGFDLVGDIPPDLLGFAVHRVDMVDGAEVWLKNPLKFARAPYTGYQVAGTDSRQAPIQQLHWVDEAVQPDHLYRYTVALVGGTPAQPILGISCDLSLRTAPSTLGDMSLVFNRGTTATRKNPQGSPRSLDRGEELRAGRMATSDSSAPMLHRLSRKSPCCML